MNNLETVATLRKVVNNLMKQNAKANAEERIKILNDHSELLTDLKTGVSQTSSVKFNRYRPLLNRLNNWVLNCKSKKSKDYKRKLTYRNETPSEIKDNMKTSNRLYQGKSNYYVGGKLVPTKEDLKDLDVQQQVKNLKWLRSNLKNKTQNRMRISEFIKQTKDDLRETLKSKHGINHQGRTDNTPSPQTQHRISKFQLNNLLNNSQIAREIYHGFSQAEVAKKHGINQSTVHRRLKKLRPLLE